MKQKVTDHEGEVIEQKAGCAMQRTHNGPLFPTRLAASAHGRSDPDSPPGRACATCGSSPWTRHRGGPAHLWARPSGDLGPDARGTSSLGVDRMHRDLLAEQGLVHRS